MEPGLDSVWLPEVDLRGLCCHGDQLREVYERVYALGSVSEEAKLGNVCVGYNCILEHSLEQVIRQKVRGSRGDARGVRGEGERNGVRTTRQ
jgi:hypothetical protein